MPDAEAAVLYIDDARFDHHIAGIEQRFDEPALRAQQYWRNAFAFMQMDEAGLFPVIYAARLHVLKVRYIVHMIEQVEFAPVDPYR